MEPEFFVTVGMFVFGVLITFATIAVVLLSRNRNGGNDHNGENR